MPRPSVPTGCSRSRCASSRLSYRRVARVADRLHSAVGGPAVGPVLPGIVRAEGPDARPLVGHRKCRARAHAPLGWELACAAAMTAADKADAVICMKGAGLLTGFRPFCVRANANHRTCQGGLSGLPQARAGWRSRDTLRHRRRAARSPSLPARPVVRQRRRTLRTHLAYGLLAAPHERVHACGKEILTILHREGQAATAPAIAPSTRPAATWPPNSTRCTAKYCSRRRKRKDACLFLLARLTYLQKGSGAESAERLSRRCI